MRWNFRKAHWKRFCLQENPLRDCHLRAQQTLRKDVRNYPPKGTPTKGGPRHVHVHSRMCDVCVPLRHFYGGKFDIVTKLLSQK